MLSLVDYCSQFFISKFIQQNRKPKYFASIRIEFLLNSRKYAKGIDETVFSQSMLQGINSILFESDAKVIKKFAAPIRFLQHSLLTLELLILGVLSSFSHVTPTNWEGGLRPSLFTCPLVVNRSPSKYFT